MWLKCDDERARIVDANLISAYGRKRTFRLSLIRGFLTSALEKKAAIRLLTTQLLRRNARFPFLQEPDDLLFRTSPLHVQPPALRPDSSPSRFSLRRGCRIQFSGKKTSRGPSK